MSQSVLLFFLIIFCVNTQTICSNVLEQGSCPTMPVLSCPPTSMERGAPGNPGKRGPKGERGGTGETGLKGERGQPDESKAAISRIENQFQELKENYEQLVEEMQHYTRRSCDDIYRLGFREDGVYNISLGEHFVEAYCEFQVDGRNWMIIQRRYNGSVDFFRNWDEYVNGFGNKAGEYWLGLDSIHFVTTTRMHHLRVDLEDWEENIYYADYSTFSIGGAETNYQLTVGGHSGNIADSMNYHNGSQFSTKDRDNDGASGNCAVAAHGAWWYLKCFDSNLNGRYQNRNPTSDDTAIGWYSWRRKYSMKRVQMKIRPK